MKNKKNIIKVKELIWELKDNLREFELSNKLDFTETKYDYWLTVELPDEIDYILKNGIDLWEKNYTSEHSTNGRYENKL